MQNTETTDYNALALELLPALRGMFAKMGLPQDQIEDAAHNGFVFLVTYALPKWNGKGKLATYATTAVKRRYFDHIDLHGNQSAKRASFPCEDGDWGSDLSEFVADESALRDRERLEASEGLRDALARLSAADRKLLAAVEAHDGNWAAAARELGISKATASRARARIRESLDGWRTGEE